MLRHLLQKISPFALLTLLLALFFFPILFQGKVFLTTGLIQSDLMNLSYPIKDFLSNSLKSGQLPLWVKNLGNGYPLFAEGQVGALFPINFVLFRFLPTLTAFNWTIYLSFLATATSMFILARFGERLSTFASLLAAISFGLGGFMIIHLTHLNMIQTIALLPLEILILNRALQKSRLKWSCLALGVCLSLQIFAGHHEVLYFSLLCLTFYLLIRTISHHRETGQFGWRPWLAIFWGGLLALGLSAVQTLPTLELIQHSTRSRGLSFRTATFYRLPAEHLLSALSPKKFDFTTPVFYDFANGAASIWENYSYIGIIPLTLGIFFTTVVVTKIIRKRPVGAVAAYLGVALLALLLAFGRSTPLFEIFWRLVPGARLFQHPTRLLLFTQLPMTLLAGHGLDRLTRNLRPVKKHLASGVLLALTIIDLGLTQRNINLTAPANEWFTQPPAVSFLESKLSPDYRLHTLGTNFFDYGLIYNFQAQKELQNLLPANFSLLHRTPSTEGLFGLALSRTSQLASKTTFSGIWLDEENRLKMGPGFSRLLGYQAAKYILSDVPIEDPNLKPTQQIKFSKPYCRNVLLSPGGDFTQTYLGDTVYSDKVYIWENLNVLPRAYFAKEALVLKKDQNTLEKLVTLENPRQTVLLEESSGLDNPPTDNHPKEKLPPTFILITPDGGLMSMG